jgi:hypothetical protein
MMLKNAVSALEVRDDTSFGENEHYAPSSDGSDLAEDMDRLLNGGSSLSPVCRDNHNTDEDGSELVDYEDDEPGMLFRNEPEDDRTRSVNVNAFGDYLEDADKALDDNRFEQKDKVGDEQPATQDSRDNSPVGQPMAERPATSEQVIPPEMRRENVVNPVGQPVLTQQALMEIISRQPHAIMQKMGWERTEKAKLQRIAERL